MTADVTVVAIEVDGEIVWVRAYTGKSDAQCIGYAKTALGTRAVSNEIAVSEGGKYTIRMWGDSISLPPVEPSPGVPDAPA